MAGSVAKTLYVLADAVKGLKANLVTSVLTALTIAFALALFTFFATVAINLNEAVKRLGDKAQVIVYVKDGQRLGVAEMRASIMNIPGVSDARYVSKDAAIADLRRELGSHVSVLDGLAENPVPASFELRLDAIHRDPSKIDAIAAAVENWNWVEDVHYSRELVERFSAFIRLFKLGALVFGAFLGAAVLFIISNTIRLTIYSRRDEIEIMKLVGATDSYVKAPFYVEGVIQGCVGGSASMGFVLAGSALLASRVPAYLSFALEAPLSSGLLFFVLVFAGATLGAVGSFLSLTRTLKD